MAEGKREGVQMSNDLLEVAKESMATAERRLNDSDTDGAVVFMMAAIKEIIAALEEKPTLPPVDG